MDSSIKSSGLASSRGICAPVSPRCFRLCVLSLDRLTELPRYRSSLWFEPIAGRFLPFLCVHVQVRSRPTDRRSTEPLRRRSWLYSRVRASLSLLLSQVAIVSLPRQNQSLSLVIHSPQTSSPTLSPFKLLNRVLDLRDHELISLSLSIPFKLTSRLLLSSFSQHATVWSAGARVAIGHHPAAVRPRQRPTRPRAASDVPARPRLHLLLIAHLAVAPAPARESRRLFGEE